MHLFGAGMDLCWLQAVAAFVLHALFDYRVPILFLLAIYGCGILTNRFCYSRRRLRLQVFLLKVILFSAAFLVATQFFLFRYNDNDLSSQLSRMLGPHDPFLEWSLALLILVMAGITWRRSTIHVLQPPSPENVYLRLDLGIAVFFSLLVIRLMVFGRFNVTILYPDLKYLFFPFFLFALLTIGLMWHDGRGRRQYASGFGRMGVILSFGAVMVSGGLGMVALFHSQMTASARVLSGILKKAGPPLESAVIWLGRILWSSRRNDVRPPPSPLKDQGSFAEVARNTVETGWLTSVLKWGTMALLAMTLLFLFYLLLRYLLKYLTTRTDSKHLRQFRVFDFPQWVKRLMAFVARILSRIPAPLKRVNSAEGLFTALMSWGRRSGIPHKRTDTPMEYGARLTAAFPGLRAEIETIIRLLYMETYGQLALDHLQIATGRSAKRRLAHPVFWKDRIKAWIFAPGK